MPKCNVERAMILANRRSREERQSVSFDPGTKRLLYWDENAEPAYGVTAGEVCQGA